MAFFFSRTSLPRSNTLPQTSSTANNDCPEPFRPNGSQPPNYSTVDVSSVDLNEEFPPAPPRYSILQHRNSSNNMQTRPNPTPSPSQTKHEYHIFRPTLVAHSKSCAGVPEGGTIASLRLQTLGGRVCLEPSGKEMRHHLEAASPLADLSMGSPANSRLLSPCSGGDEEDANYVEVEEDEDEQMADRNQQLLDGKDQTQQQQNKSKTNCT